MRNMRKSKAEVQEDPDMIEGQMSLFAEEPEPARSSARPKRKAKTAVKGKAGKEPAAKPVRPEPSKPQCKAGKRAENPEEKAAEPTHYDESSFPMNQPVEESPKPKAQTGPVAGSSKEDTQPRTASAVDTDPDTLILHWKTGRPKSLGQYLCRVHDMYVLLYYFPGGPQDGDRHTPGWYGYYPGDQTVSWHFVLETEITRWAELTEE